MSDRDEDNAKRIGLWIAGGAAALAAALTVFFSAWGWETGRIEGSPNYGVVSEASANAMNGEADAALAAMAAEGGEAAPMTADEASVVVEDGIVKFYFATGRADLAEGAQEALKDVLAGVKEGKKAIVSGFHDETGGKDVNEELSKKRALSVKNALMGWGVAEEQIELRKPADTEGSGNNAEARRVEVVLE